jgi:3-oxoacyl-[acyl-carrier-protein] synthase-1
MVTPVGLSAPETAASARSRTPRLTEIAWQDSRFKPFTVGVVPDDGLPDLNPDLEKPPLQYRQARMLRLAQMPLQEALVSLPKTAAGVPIVLGLPELHTTMPLQPEEFLKRLAKQCIVNLDLPKSSGIPRGRAAGLLAIKEATERLARKEAEFVLAGGVDSYIDLYVMGTLDMQKRVRGEINADGFAPAEGAGFVLLCTAEAAQKHGQKPLARVMACSEGREPGHVYSEEPYRGDGLSETFEALFAAAGQAPPVGCVYASFNGERYWAKEFGVALLRHKEHLAGDHQMEHPAECFGDLGAAHGSVMAGLACLGIKDGYRRTPALVYSSSDYADRAALLVGKA